MRQRLNYKSAFPSLPSWPPAAMLCIMLSGMIFMAAACQDAPNPSVSATSARQDEAIIRVAAAANLQFALESIVTSFEQQRPHWDVEITYGSSGNFFAQLSQRAPYDIFFSADTHYPQRLHEAGLVLSDGYFQYAKGRIVVWIRNDSPLDLEAQGLEVLADPRVKKIAIANPRLAPYGKAAEQAMKNVGLYDRVRKRLVLGESVTQTAHFIDSGAADAGIIALSLAAAPQMKQKGRYWEIPRRFHEPIEQAGVLPLWSHNPEGAKELKSLVMGEQGRKILREHGYLPPDS